MHSAYPSGRGSTSRPLRNTPAATAVLDPFHVVRLNAESLDGCRRRVQQSVHGHRGRTGEPLYAARHTLHTGRDMLTDAQLDRIEALFANDDLAEVQVTWAVFQQMIAAYRHLDRACGRDIMTKFIASLSCGVPAPLIELRRLGRTLTRRAGYILAYLDRPGTSNGPIEAINGRLKHLRGSALGFRNLTNYVARFLLECGRFRPQPHAAL